MVTASFAIDAQQCFGLFISEALTTEITEGQWVSSLPLKQTLFYHIFLQMQGLFRLK
jgi:hypothetical protein